MTHRTMINHDVHIRPAEPDDLDALHAMDVQVFGQLAYPFFVIRQLLDTHSNCWLVADHPFGLAGYSLGVPTWDHTSAWLLALAVHPEHRHQGYGSRLTLESLKLLQSMDVPEVRLTVEPGNETAITLYRRFGFCVIDRRADYLGPGHDRIIMVRSLLPYSPTEAGPRLPSRTIPTPRLISGSP